MNDHSLRAVIYGDVLIIIVLAILSYGIVAHFNSTTDQIRDVNAAQDARDVQTCDRGNHVRALLHSSIADLEARAAVRPPAATITLTDAERIIPIVDCATDKPLRVGEQRAYVQRLLALTRR